MITSTSGAGDRKNRCVPIITSPETQHRRQTMPIAFISGAAVGVLGGMIGLGGAEFRLPLLVGLFGFVALQAVILNKALSLSLIHI